MCYFPIHFALPPTRQTQPSSMVLVDNNPVSFLAQPSNGVPVPSFYDDPEDDALPVGGVVSGCVSHSRRTMDVCVVRMCMLLSVLERADDGSEVLECLRMEDALLERRSCLVLPLRPTNHTSIHPSTQRVADLIDEHLAQADDVRPPLTRLFRLEEQLAPIRRQLRLKGVGGEGKEEEGEEDGLPRSEAGVKRGVPPQRFRR